MRKVCYDCFNKDLHNLDLEILNNWIDNSDNEINNTNNKDDEENSVSNESYVPVNEKVGAAYPLQVKHKKGTYGSCNICIWFDTRYLCNTILVGPDIKKL